MRQPRELKWFMIGSIAVAVYIVVIIAALFLLAELASLVQWGN